MNYYPDVYLDLDLIKIKVDRENQPPNTPSRPSGPTSGNINTFYTYTTSATDPNNDELYYQWYWGDEYSSWFGPYPSGQQVSARHSWNERGTYNIKVRVKDEYGEKSPWSPPLSVSMPRGKTAINYPFLHLIKQITIKHILQLYTASYGYI